MLRTYIYTGWLQAHIHPVGTVVTFCCSMGVGVYVERIIRTRLGTSLTSDTAAVVKVHNAVLPYMQGFYRTDFYTGSICTMVAAHHRKQTPGVGKGTFLHLLHPGAVYPHRYVVLRLTGHCTGMAPYTFAVVNDKSILHSRVYS